jgi:hypothetical protein
MANAIYPKWKQALILGTANSALTGSGTTGLYVALVDTGVYTYNVAHEFYSSLTGIAGTDQEVTAVTAVDGIVDGNNTTHTAVAAGATLEALVLYRRNTGANTTWRLVCYLDSSVTGLPVTPNGGDITITWNATGIFGL